MQAITACVLKFKLECLANEKYPLKRTHLTFDDVDS